MIDVDTSALMAILLDNPSAHDCIAALGTEDHILISAGTVAEMLIASARRNVGAGTANFIVGLGFDIVSVTPAAARRIAQVCEQLGKSVSPAALNFGDCFACEAAKQHACRLLYVGVDFSKSDAEGVL